MNSEFVYQIVDGKIKLSRYKVTYNQTYDSYIEGVPAGETQEHSRYFLNEEDATGFVERYLSKHKALEYVSTEALDVSDIEWVDNIPIPKGYECAHDYVREVLEMGEEAYIESVTYTVEYYLMDLDYRQSLTELGLN